MKRLSKQEIRYTTDLLRLYLNWPDRIDAQAGESEMFHAWLHDNYSQLSVVKNHCTKENVDAFLNDNEEVIDACRVLKTEKTVEDRSRQGMRVSLVAKAFGVVYDCQENPGLIGVTLKSTIMDVSNSGVGLELEAHIPVSTIVSVTIIPPGTPISIFTMSGEVRWCVKKDGKYQAGLKFYEIEDYDKWQDEFFNRFLSR